MHHKSLTINQWRNIALLVAIVGPISWWAFLTAPFSGNLSALVTATHSDSASLPTLPLSRKDSLHQPTQQLVSAAYGKLPMSFEINNGQTDSSVKFLARGAGYNLFLTSSEAVLSLLTKSANKGAQPSGSASNVIRMRPVFANTHPQIEGVDQLPGKSNYFIGNDPKLWRRNVANFNRVNYHEIYKGVDLVFYGNQRQLENDFIVAPGADPKVIQLAFDGAQKISINQEGNLELQTGEGQAELEKPLIYQLDNGVRQQVEGNYVLNSGRVGFEIEPYDRKRSLIIDPVLVYSTYLGGNGTDEGDAMAVDDAGNAYVTGVTTSTIFPGATPPEHGFNDVFVVKFNPTGSALLYSTYLGGSNSEEGFDIAVDSGGDAYITGKTTSANFPVMNAFKSTYSGGTDEDAFVTRINSTGSALVYSTYLAGNFGARGWSIAASSSQGFAYVTGTTSTNFPVTASAFEATNFNSGFMTKLCTNCSGAASLVYSTFLAHTGFAEGRGIAADVGGNVYLTGNLNATTTNFATPGAFQTAFGGGSADAFVEKFDTNLSGAASRVYATYLGGSAKDIGSFEGAGNPGKGIAIDVAGNAYVVGSTSSTNFPLANATQSLNGGQNDVFVTKLNSTATSLVYSTYLGGTGDDFGRSIGVNVAGAATVTGVAGPSFPTSNALPTPNAGVGFVTKFTPSGTTVVYSTILSGVTNGSFGLALDSAGNAFATGSTNASIVTFAPFQPTNGGGGTDGWVSVIADPTILGRVRDGFSNPLPGATVNLVGVPSATTTTDANGYYTFGLLTPGNSYTVSVTFPNLVFISQTVNNLQKNVRLDIGPVFHIPVRFSSGTYSVNEGAGSLTVTVIRSGDVTNASSVDYKTTDTDTFTAGCADIVNNAGGAFGRCDYSTSVDTLTFAPGEITKTFIIPIIDDSYAEGNETFGITLLNAVNAEVTIPATAVVTINDNETVNGPNPIFNTTFFVRQQYLDFLSREPEAGEPWSAVLNGCSDVNNNPLCDRLTVSAAFFGSAEFQLKGYFVYRFYKVAFNRLPTYPEIVTDMRSVTGQTPAEVFQKKGAFTNAFVLRPEFVTAFGSTTNAQYVTALMGSYGLTQITTPDPAAPDGSVKVTLTIADLTNQLGVSITRAQVLRAIADSDQVSAIEFNPAFVAMQYFGYLRRSPDAVGFNAWLDYLTAHPTDSRTMVNGFMNSAEYRLRFGPA